jgi:omega-6 fatty acid desaturase (delta-12 desaturase)
MSLFIGRTFIIFHDCCHNSYTPNKTINYILSNILGIFCLTSSNWGLNHKKHHITSGNIDNKYNYNFNDIVFTTVNRFNKFTRLQKYIYLTIYNPLILYCIIPFVLFFILQRGFFNILPLPYNRTKIGYFKTNLTPHLNLKTINNIE